MKKIVFGLVLSGIFLLASCLGEGNTGGLVEGKRLPSQVDYNFHIKPILSDRCFACHGPDEAKRGAGLRLDTQEGMFARLEHGGHAVVKGSPRRSQIMDRIHSVDPEIQMPPPESNLSLTDFEKALLEKWIKQGAEFKEHWSFIAPKKEALPVITAADWPKNEIDHFVLSKLEIEGLTPAERASKEALIRRLSFDLTGLPPSIEEVDRFLNDTDEDAYEQLVDRLLASEQYGERMATDWLAVARYGDTHGYEADSRRMAWQWRDWVIRSFNQNKPYDAFITEQMAGDLLPEPTRDQLIATAFNRNHLMNSENGIIDEEWRVEYVSDRTNTTGKAVMGLTMECAKCHDHKYDPISQKDYFSLFAFFNNVDEPGQIRYQSQAFPVLNLTSKKQDIVLEQLEEESEAQRNSIAEYIEELKANDEWKTKTSKQINLNKDLKVHVSFEKTLPGKDKPIFINKADRKRPIQMYVGEEKLIDGPFGKAMEYDGVNQTLITDSGNSFEGNEAFSYAFWVIFPEPFQMARLMGTEDGNFDLVPGYLFFIEHDKLSFQLCSTWDHNYIKVRTQNSFPFQQWTHLAVTYDGSSKAAGVKIYIDGELQPLDILKDNLNKKLDTGGWFTIGHYSMEGGALDEFRQYSRVLSTPEVQTLAKQEISEEGWFDHYTNQEKRLVRLRDYLKQTLQQRIALLDTVPQLMVMKDLQDSIRPTYVLNRGIYDDPGEEVSAKTPGAILAFSEKLPKNRLGLAQWLFDKENPLTSRVMVNRMWQMVFGKGLVSTPDDFGNQGALPSHPALLDWLAVEFQENGWDMKALIKKMVMSATYQQSSTVSPELLEKDPNNEFLARGVRYRWPAEMVRDNALAVSGLLVDSIGGEPVKPYQPEGLWAQVSSTKIPYVQDHGESLYRRSLYTYWKRAAPPPNMLTFDAPSRHTCTVKTEATSTPLQALVLLNDVQFVEAARVFAQRLLQESRERTATIEKAFRMATSRKPTAAELSTLKELWDESRSEFEEIPGNADKVIGIGEYPIEGEIDKIELAALTMVTSAILNLNETITKS